MPAGPSDFLQRLRMCGPLLRNLRSLDLSHNPNMSFRFNLARFYWQHILMQATKLQLLDLRDTGEPPAAACLPRCQPARLPGCCSCH